MTFLDEPGLVEIRLPVRNRRAVGNGSCRSIRANPAPFEAWIAGAALDVAIEAVFRDREDSLRGFVGLRRTIDGDRATFWRALIAATAPPSAGARATLMSWLTHVGKPTLLDAPPDSIELGVFNQWKSAGAIALPVGGLTDAQWANGPAWLRDGRQPRSAASSLAQAREDLG